MKQTLLMLPYYADPCFEHVAAVANSGLQSVELRGHACIDQVRAVLVAHALRTPADVFLFVDGDMFFRYSDLQPFISTCRERGGILGAFYATKRRGGRVVGVPMFDRGTGDVIEAESVGLGFTAIARSALERMVANFPPVIMSAVEEYASPLFLPRIVSNRCYGEDFSFCLRARECGIPIAIDTRPQLAHYGRYGYQLEDVARTPIKEAP